MKRNIENYLDLVLVLTQKEMKVRYKNKVLGYFWSIAHPFALSFVFYIAFKVVMKIQMQDYVIFLITGLFPWQWFLNSVSASPMSFLMNASIIKKVNFPRNIIPLTVTLQDMIHFILSIPVIGFFMIIYNKLPFLSWIYLIPILLIIQFLITYGISLMLSSINLFFRDLERLIIIFMTFLFYITPVVYSETMIPEKYKYLLNFNPFAVLIISWRKIFLTGSLDLESFAIILGYSLLIYFLGWIIYRKLSWRFAEVL